MVVHTVPPSVDTCHEYVMGVGPGVSIAAMMNNAWPGAHTVSLAGWLYTVGTVALAVRESKIELTNSKPDK